MDIDDVSNSDLKNLFEHSLNVDKSTKKTIPNQRVSPEVLMMFKKMRADFLEYPGTIADVAFRKMFIDLYGIEQYQSIIHKFKNSNDDLTKILNFKKNSN